MMLRAWTLGAAAAATVIFSGFVAALFVASEGLPLVFTAAVVGTLLVSMGVLLALLARKSGQQFGIHQT